MTTVTSENEIKEMILKKLGFPKNVIKVDVKPITAHTYRVNVWTRQEDGLVVGGKITYSELVELPSV